MKRFFPAALAGFAIILVAGMFLGTPTRKVDLSALDGDVERGAYIARLAGCVSCHTRPKDGGLLLAGGPPLITPFGTFYGPNITPDPAFGIGRWSADDFADALYNGHSNSTGHLFPVFPFTSYAKMDTGDAADLWAWLQSVPKSAEPSRAHALSGPHVSRALMAPWKTLFHDVKPLPRDAERSARWNRGHYIVMGIGHCAECHTPRGLFGELDQSRSLAGATLPPKGEKVPPLTRQALVKRGYTKGDLLMAFQFGLVPDGDVLGGAMGEVLSDQLEYLTMEDLEAIAAFLLDED